MVPASACAPLVLTRAARRNTSTHSTEALMPRLTRSIPSRSSSRATCLTVARETMNRVEGFVCGH